MRDTLIKLIKEAYPIWCHSPRNFEIVCADHLIKNGVIIEYRKARTKRSDKNNDIIKSYIEENRILQEDVKRLSAYIETLEYALQKISGALDDIDW